jgi:DNA-binding Lrp family transcriptional regulator
MDAIDRRIVNALQDGFPVCERPFAAVAGTLDLDERELIERIDRLLADGTLTRFGPLFDAGKLGGAFALAAMSVPPTDVDRVAATLNAMPEVAHNYERDHALNLWFVLATAVPDDVAETVARIERDTGIAVLVLPKEREFFVDLRLRA